jgi:bacillithiol biosynthesis deacetylase BshB1
MKQYDVVIFGAHPDDVEMAMGGTAAKLASAGFSVLSVSLTPSEMSTYGDVVSRAEEFRRANEILGTDGRILDFVDTQVENTPAARLKIAKLLRETRPQIVFAPYHTNPITELGGIANVDHYTTGALVRDGAKMARIEKTIPDLPRHTIAQLYYYMLPEHIRPTIIVDVSDTFDQALQAIRAYETQLQINLAGAEIERVLTLRRATCGLTIGAAYAEPFLAELPLRFSPEMFFAV